MKTRYKPDAKATSTGNSSACSCELHCGMFTISIDVLSVLCAIMAECLAQTSKINPKFGICCLSGKIKIPPAPEPPNELDELYYGQTTNAKHFLSDIRKFNCGLSIATMRTNDATIPGGIGNFCIHVQVFRQMGPPLTSENTTLSCLQTHFYNPEGQITRRLKILPLQPHHHEKDRVLFAILQTTLHRVNYYLQ